MKLAECNEKLYEQGLLRLLAKKVFHGCSTQLFPSYIKRFLLVPVLVTVASLVFSQDKDAATPSAQNPSVESIKTSDVLTQKALGGGTASVQSGLGESASSSQETLDKATPSSQSDLGADTPSSQDTLQGASFASLFSAIPFNSFKLQTVFSFNTTLYSDDNAKNTYGASALAKANFRDLTAVYAYKIPSTKYSEGFNKENADAVKFSNVGAEFRLNKIVGVPLSFMVGRLSLSGALQKITTPYMSTSLSFFNRTIPLPTVARTRLPSRTTVIKPLTFSAFYDSTKSDPKFNPAGKVLKRLAFSLLAQDNANFATSTSAIFRLPASVFLSFSETLLFSRVDNVPKTWYTKDPIIYDTQFLFSNTQVHLSTKHYKTKLTVNFYDLMSAKRYFRPTVLWENGLNFRHFGLNTAGFYSRGDQVCLPSGKYLSVLSQLKVNPYLTFFPHGTVFRVGATYYVEERRKAPDDFVVNHKWGAGVISEGKWHFAKLVFKTYAIENSSFNHYLYTYCSLKLPLKPTFHTNYSFIGKSDTHKLSTDAAIFALLAKSHASSLSLSANIGLDAAISPDDTTLAPTVNLKFFHKTKYADFSYYIKVKGKVEEL